MKDFLWHIEHQKEHKADWVANCNICINKFVHRKPLVLIRLIDAMISLFIGEIEDE